jgi:hypothetical protein
VVLRRSKMHRHTEVNGRKGPGMVEEARLGTM